MRKKFLVTAICLGFLMIGALPAGAQTRVVGGYTFIGGGRGPQACLGHWIPSGDIAAPGTCEGQLVDVSQLTAVSAGQTADRLSQVLDSLDSIDQRLADTNEQIGRLIDATVDTRESIDKQVKSVSEILHEIVVKRFDQLPAKMLASKEFREEITKLKEEILGDVEKLYPAPKASPTK